MTNWLERTELLLGEEIIKKFKNEHVLIVGLGGVGSFAAEFIARSGIGKMTIVDGDTVDITNINRQLPALNSTVGKNKVEVVGERLLDINPDIELTMLNEFLTPERMNEIVKSNNFSYVMDCIDSVSPKIHLLVACRRNKVKVVSSMGAGGKMDPSKVKVIDISRTENCKLAQKVRKRLKKEHKINRGIRAVFSTEIQIENSLKMTDGKNFKRSFYGTNSYMPAIFGLCAAAEVIRYLAKKNN